MSASREKRQRIEQRKTEDSQNYKTKKKGQPSKIRKRVVIVSCAVVLVILLALLVMGSGIIQSNATALTVGDTKVSIAEYNYHYNSYANNYIDYFISQIGEEYLTSILDLSSSFKSQMFDETRSWADFFHEGAINNLQLVVTKSNKAKEEGLSISDEVRANLANEMVSIESYAQSYSKSANSLLSEIYGPGVNMTNMAQFMERQSYAELWDTTVRDNFTCSDEELEEAYQNDRQSYDMVTYRSYTFSGTIDTELLGLEGEEAEAAEEEANAAARDRANEMLAKVTSGNFKALADEYTLIEDPEADVTDDNTYNRLMKYSEVTNESLANWLFDGSRKQGDKTVIEDDSSNFIVVAVEWIGRIEEPTKSSRHILISFDSDEESDHEAARVKAEEILDTWKAGDATEESFAQLAKDNSDDTGSVETGGLYENVARREFVQPYEDWIYNSSRSYGDVDIVETTYGYHILFFVGDGDNGIPYWKKQVKTALSEENLTELQNQISESNPVRENGLAMILARTRQ